MDKHFQNRIDEYLLHADRMTDEAKQQFLREIEQDAEKKAQFEFTRQLKQAIASRETKLKELNAMKLRYEAEQRSKRGAASTAAPSKNTWKRALLAFSGMAAVVLLGFLIVRPMLLTDSPNPESAPVRGGNEVFDGGVATEADSLNIDSLKQSLIEYDTLQQTTP